MVGVGLDIAEIGRFERLVDRGAGRIWAHWYTEAEAAECLRHPRPALAAAFRFAVKEATYKAVGAEFLGAVRWQDIEVTGREQAWRVALHGEVAAGAAAAYADLLHVSTCRTDGRVVAIVIAEGRASSRDRQHEVPSHAYAASQTTNRRPR